MYINSHLNNPIIISKPVVFIKNQINEEMDSDHYLGQSPDISQINNQNDQSIFNQMKQYVQVHKECYQSNSVKLKLKTDNLQTIQNSQDQGTQVDQFLKATKEKILQLRQNINQFNEQNISKNISKNTIVSNISKIKINNNTYVKKISDSSFNQNSNNSKSIDVFMDNWLKESSDIDVIKLFKTSTQQQSDQNEQFLHYCAKKIQNFYIIYIKRKNQSLKRIKEQMRLRKIQMKKFQQENQQEQLDISTENTNKLIYISDDSNQNQVNLKINEQNQIENLQMQLNSVVPLNISIDSSCDDQQNNQQMQQNIIQNISTNLNQININLNQNLKSQSQTQNSVNSSNASIQNLQNLRYLKKQQSLKKPLSEKLNFIQNATSLIDCWHKPSPRQLSIIHSIQGSAQNIQYDSLDFTKKFTAHYRQSSSNLRLSNQSQQINEFIKQNTEQHKQISEFTNYSIKYNFQFLVESFECNYDKKKLEIYNKLKNNNIQNTHIDNQIPFIQKNSNFCSQIIQSNIHSLHEELNDHYLLLKKK